MRAKSVRILSCEAAQKFINLMVFTLIMSDLIKKIEREYNMKFVLVFNKVEGKKPEGYLLALKRLGRNVYSQTDFYINSVSPDSFQIGFTPIRTKFEHSQLVELIIFDDLVKNEFPEYKTMVFHCKQGHDWGKNYE